jgi:hypothetical protein
LSPDGGRARGARGDDSRGEEQNANMRRRLLVMAPILACVTLAGCTGGPASSASRPAGPTTGPTEGPTTRAAAGPVGSPDNPVLFSCGEEVSTSDPVPQQPQPGDLAVGPLIIISGKMVATADPAGFGGHGDYKIPFVVTGGSTVTVTIGALARGHVVIDNPYAPYGVTAATYHSCPHAHGFFAQGFAFTNGQIRGCVPLEVRVGGQARVQRVTLSLFAGSCAA